MGSIPMLITSEKDEKMLLVDIKLLINCLSEV